MKILNLDVVDIPADYTPLDGIFLLKCLDANGGVVMCARYTAGMTPWEKIGMLESETVIAKDKLMGNTVDVN